MTHQTFLTDLKATRDRGEWWVVLTIADSSGNPVTLTYSRRGTRNKTMSVTVAGDVISAHQRFDKRVLKVPEITHSMWREGAFLSNSLPSYSNLIINNTDRGLDQYAPKNGYIWLGGIIKVYFFDYMDIAGTIGKKFEGKLGQPTFGLNYELNIPVVGNEEQFNRPLHNRVYRGTSYQLEIFGEKTISYGTPAAVNLTGNLTLEGWFWLEALPTVGRRVWGWGSGANFPWSLGVINDGTIVLSCTISGGLQFRVSTTILGIKKPYHISVRTLGRDVVFTIWDDDNQTLTQETWVNAFTSAARDAFATGGAGTGYLLRSDSDATFTPWFDEMRVWNYYRTDQEIAQDRFRPLNSGTVPATCVHYTSMDHSTGTTVTDHSATAAHGTITGVGTHTWLWAMEGGSSLAGTSKIDVIGMRGGVRPILVDPIRYIYQAHWGDTQSIQAYEGGSARTMSATLASMRALMVSVAPAAGNATQYLARGYFKLPPIPSLPVSALVSGAKDGTLGYVETVSKVSRYLATRRAGIADPGGINTSSYTTFEAGTNPVVGFAYYDGGRDKKVRGALDDVLRSGMAWWGYLRGSSLFHIQRFSTSGVASKNYDERYIVNIEDTSSEAVIYGVEVRYKYNDVVHSEEQMATSVKGTAAWETFTKPFLIKSAIDETLRGKYEGKGGKILPVETGLYYDNDAQTLANDLLAMLKGFKQTYRIDLTIVAIADDRGQIETIAYRLQDGTVVCSLYGSESYLVVTVIDKGQEGLVAHDVLLV
jgi:hypothetical protein